MSNKRALISFHQFDVVTRLARATGTKWERTPIWYVGMTVDDVAAVLGTGFLVMAGAENKPVICGNGQYTHWQVESDGAVHLETTEDTSAFQMDLSPDGTPACAFASPDPETASATWQELAVALITLGVKQEVFAQVKQHFLMADEVSHA